MEPTPKSQDPPTTNQDDDHQSPTTRPIPSLSVSLPTHSSPFTPSIPKSPPTPTLQISIVGFQRDLSFFSSQSQIFNIQLVNIPQKQVWAINRRYSQIKWLYYVLSVNCVGYVCPYLPSLEEVEKFVTDKRLKRNREGMIDYKIGLIGKFLNEVYGNERLKSTEEANTFVLKAQKDYYRQKNKIDKLVSENIQLQTSGFAFIYVLQSASYFLWNYIGGQQQQQKLLTRQDVQFDMQIKKIQQHISNLNKLKYHLEQLCGIKVEQSKREIIKGDWPKLGIMNRSIEESREYNFEMAEGVQELTLRRVRVLILGVEEVKGKLAHREKLINFLESVRENIDDEERVIRLEGRIRVLENNFRESYGEWKVQFEKEKGQVGTEFRVIWERYRRQMRKVWM